MSPSQRRGDFKANCAAVTTAGQARRGDKIDERYRARSETKRGRINMRDMPSTWQIGFERTDRR
jgi:hypothetical protein